MKSGLLGGLPKQDQHGLHMGDELFTDLVGVFALAGIVLRLGEGETALVDIERVDLRILEINLNTRPEEGVGALLGKIRQQPDETGNVLDNPNLVQIPCEGFGPKGIDGLRVHGGSVEVSDLLNRRVLGGLEGLLGESLEEVVKPLLVLHPHLGKGVELASIGGENSPFDPLTVCITVEVVSRFDGKVHVLLL